MRRLSAPAALASFLVLGASAAPAVAMPRLPALHAADAPLMRRVADLDRPAAARHRHKGAQRHRRGQWRNRGVVITSGHPLHRFPGEIVYTYTVPACCCCGPRGW